MSIEIHMKKAGIGDCIHIRMGEHTRKLNFIIDSGKNKNGFLEADEYIKNHKEDIDVIMLTHDDDDHIMGIFERIVNEKENKLGETALCSLFSDKRVLMNYWKKDTETLFDYKKIEIIGEKLKSVNIDLSQLGYIIADPIVCINGVKKERFNLIQISWKIDEVGKIFTEIKEYTSFKECEEKGVSEKKRNGNMQNFLYLVQQRNL